MQAEPEPKAEKKPKLKKLTPNELRRNKKLRKIGLSLGHFRQGFDIRGYSRWRGEVRAQKRAMRGDKSE